MGLRLWRPLLTLVLCAASPLARAQGGAVLESRGEASYRIPIVVPPGPAGHQPDLALVYNSGDGRGPAGWLGFGWSLSGESRIERETRTASPYDFDNATCGAGALFPCYRPAYVLDGQDLICSSGSCGTCSSAAPCRYRTQSDDGRLIHFKGDASGWEIKDRDGRVLVYGAASDGSGRLLNPASSIGQVYSWQIESSTDVNGNVIRYTYDTSSSPNIAYLRKLEYGQGTAANRSVEFVLNHPGSAPRPDRPVSARAGFRQQIDRRVISIEVRAASNALVTRYDLTYSQDPDSLRSQLATVERKGSDGVTAMPPYRFDYSFRAATRGLFGGAEASFFASATSCHAGGGLYAATSPAGVIASIADVNRDGLGDLYQVAGYSDPLAGRVAVALGTGSEFRPGPGRSCGSNAYGAGTPWSPHALLFSENDGGSAVLDLDGDGHLDHLYLTGFPGGGLEPYLRRGGPSGFSDAPLGTSFELTESGWFWLGNRAYLIDRPWIRIAETDFASDVDVIAALADVTGDGRPDLVTTRFKGPYGGGGSSTWPSWTGWAVFVNRGLKSGANGEYLDFGLQPIRWPAPLDVPIQHDYSGLISEFILADQNGDGLADRVFRSFVEYGYGAGFYAQESVPNQISSGLAATTSCTSFGTFDLNGDGFLDHVDAQGASAGNPSWLVSFGTGHGFGPQAAVFPADGGGINPGCIEANGLNASSSALRDVNGDGVPDRLRDGFGVILNAGALDPDTELDPDLPSAVLPGLMLRGTDPLGGVVEFTYQAAPQLEDAAGLPANPGFSLAKPVVTRVRYRDGRAGTPAITTRFWYGNGAFDYSEREFRGFGTVIATQVENGLDTARITTLYLTDRVCGLSPASVETSLGAAVLARESTTYQAVTGGGAVPAQWTRCLPATRVVESVEGDEAAKRVSRTAWDYGTPINPYYRLLKLQEWGEWDSATNQDVPGDERITEFSYAAASSGWPSIVARVNLETVKDSAGNVYAKRRYCYSVTCAVAARGLLLSVRDHLTDPSAAPPVIDVAKTVATIAYDAWGNPTRSTGAITGDDPDGLQSSVAYDPTYQTFPISLSRGSDVAPPLRPLVTTLGYEGCAGGSAAPPALGLPCSITAPQGRADLIGYDALGRVTRVERPNSGYAETRSYALPGAASPGQNVLESRVVRSGAADLVERQYVDGLSRMYRHESPGQQSQTRIVDRTFDARGRLLAESLPYLSGNPLLRRFSYDALGRTRVVLDADAFTQRVFRYEPWTVIEETYFGAATPANRKERAERTVDGLGRLVGVGTYEDAVGAATPYRVTAKYDAADRLLEIRDPIANDVSLCASLQMGPHCATQDHVTEIRWDTLGRRVWIDDPDSGEWKFRYDDAGLLVERTQNAGSSESRSQLLSYDRLGRLSARAFVPAGDGVANASFVYDDDDASPDFAQLVQVSSADPMGTTYLYGYDAAGRRDAVIQRTAGKEFGSAWEYDELDRVVRRLFPDGEAFDYGYDGLRLREIRADPANPAFTGTVLRRADYDALGRVSSAEIGQGAGGAALVSQAYTYDSTNGRLTRVAATAGGALVDDPDGDRVSAAGDICPNAYDPDQRDSGGLGAGSAPDGIGNACQCGDVDGNGSVTNADGWAILTLGFSFAPRVRFDLCDVDGDGSCNAYDFLAIAAALSGRSGDLQRCPPARAAHLPSSQPLDLSVEFDGLGRLRAQTGQLGAEPVSRSYGYDGLSRLKTAVGPWEKGRGVTEPVTWSYSYDALGNLRSQRSSRPAGWNGDNRSWHYYHETKPRFLVQFVQDGALWETVRGTAGGEVAEITLGQGQWEESLGWNALGMLHRYNDSTWSYDAFGEKRLSVTGSSGVATSIVSVGEDFEYDIGAQRANKSFSLDGVRIATLATSYAAQNAGTPLVLRGVIRRAAALAPPAAATLLGLGLLGLVSVTLRRRTPAWLSAAGVAVLSLGLVGLPCAAFGATLTAGPGRNGRHAEPILAYLTDHLGTIRGAVNQDGVVVETRDYAPFGESIAHAGAFSLQHRFTGQPQDDAASGLYDYGARFYNAKWGRFVSPDDVTQGFDAQGLNPFTYVLNGPTSATDPTGRFIWNGTGFGAWSTATLQSGALQGSPAVGSMPSSTASLRMLAGPPTAFFHFTNASSIRATPALLATLAKIVIVDLHAIVLAGFSQFLLNPFSSLGILIDGAVNGDAKRVKAGLGQLIRGTLVPRYGLQNGPYWGRNQTSNDRLDSVLEDAGYAHDGMCKPACSNEADRVWIQIAWSDRWRLGPYGQGYRLLGTAAFSARILWRNVTGQP